MVLVWFTNIASIAPWPARPRALRTDMHCTDAQDVFVAEFHKPPSIHCRWLEPPTNHWVGSSFLFFLFSTGKQTSHRSQVSFCWLPTFFLFSPTPWPCAYGSLRSRPRRLKLVHLIHLPPKDGKLNQRDPHGPCGLVVWWLGFPPQLNFGGLGGLESTFFFLKKTEGIPGKDERHWGRC